MIFSKLHINIRLLATLLLSFSLATCANRGTPSGGDYDLEPPQLLSVNPANGATGVKGLKTISLLFNENIDLDNATENVIITPPQSIVPRFTVINKKVKIDLRDSLQANTTYVIDFANSLADSNEKNFLSNFSLSFSTGEHIDTLAIGGKVLSADNLEPMPNIFVGLHSDLSDSAFLKKPFERISKTDSKGEFVIRGVKAKPYRLYALNDTNRDYKYDSPSEAIAFMDATIEASAELSVRTDTIYRIEKRDKHDKIGIRIPDSVIDRSYTRFLPDNLVLRLFTTKDTKKFLQKYERPNGKSFSLFFQGEMPTPKLELINAATDASRPLLLERSAKGDTLKYWITDHNIIQNDTLLACITHLQTDTLGVAREVTDTLKLFYRKPKVKKEENPKDEEIKIANFLSISNNMAGSVDIPKRIFIEFEEPVQNFSNEKLRLQTGKDSVWSKVDFTAIADTLNPRKYWIDFDRKAGSEYRLSADSAAFLSYTDLHTNKLDEKFSIKKEEEYSMLKLSIQGISSSNEAFVELLDKADNPIRKAKVEAGSATFRYLPAGTYYARLVEDRNGNGVWDAGDFEKKMQPETVYYSPKAYELRLNWDAEEDWDVNATEVTQQKAKAITKNKPKELKNKRQQLEEQEQRSREKSQERNNEDYSFLK